MKKIVSYMMIVLTSLLILLAGGAEHASAAALSDGARLLSEADRQRVEESLSAAEQKYGVTLSVVTVRSLGGLSPAAYGSRFLAQSGRKGPNGNMVLLIAMDTRDWHISADRAMLTRIPEKLMASQAKSMILPSLKKGEYAAAFLGYGAMAEKDLAYYAEKGTAYDPSQEFNPLAAGIGFILAVLLGMAVRQYFVNRMSNVRPAASAAVYLDRDSFELLEHRDLFVHTSVRVVPKPRQDHVNMDSGGSGGGGGVGGKF